jgi:hypothetical protein
MDGRDPLEWRSKYSDPKAKQGIRIEATYLACLLFGVPLMMVLLWSELPRRFIELPDAKFTSLCTFGFAWLGGTLGGTLFSLKWLYHSVARRKWHLDRRLWRLFTPHISGGLAFAMTTLMASGAITLVNQNALHNHAFTVGAAFLVGYFSDSAIAKLYEVAETLFGTTRAPDQNETEEEDSPALKLPGRAEIATADKPTEALAEKPTEKDVVDSKP